MNSSYWFVINAAKAKCASQGAWIEEMRMKVKTLALRAADQHRSHHGEGVSHVGYILVGRSQLIRVEEFGNGICRIGHFNELRVVCETNEQPFLLSSDIEESQAVLYRRYQTCAPDPPLVDFKVDNQPQHHTESIGLGYFLERLVTDMYVFNQELTFILGTSLVAL